jgi:tricarballylate dehydrogenase
MARGLSKGERCVPLEHHLADQSGCLIDEKTPASLATFEPAAALYAAIELVVDQSSGHVAGVKVRDEEGIKVLATKAVVLGCGGFEANVQMRTQHIGPLVGAAKVRGTPHNQGDGLRMAMNIGAMPWGQWSGCHATPISADWGDFAPRELTDRSNRLSYVYAVMIKQHPVTKE